MSDDTVNSQETEVFAELTDAQADKLFENGGILDEPKAEPEAESTEDEKIVEDAVKAEVEQPKEEKKVNLGALHEERAKRKELEGKMAVMEDRFKQLVQNLTQPDKKELPSVEDDPVTNLNARLEQAENFQKQYNEQQQQITQQQRVISAYNAQAAEFSRETPDFGDAYNYVLSNRLEELKAMGLTHEQAIENARQEEYTIALRSLQDGVNPADRIYQIAKLRGYTKSAPKAEGKKDLSVIEKGQKNAKVSGSATPEGELSLEALAEMDDEEFSKAWAKLKKQNEK